MPRCAEGLQDVGAAGAFDFRRLFRRRRFSDAARLPACRHVADADDADVNIAACRRRRYAADATYKMPPMQH